MLGSLGTYQPKNEEKNYLKLFDNLCITDHLSNFKLILNTESSCGI